MKWVLTILQSLILALFIGFIWLLAMRGQWQRRFGARSHKDYKSPAVRRFKSRLDHLEAIRRWLRLYQGWIEAAGKTAKAAEANARAWVLIQCFGTVGLCISQGPIAALLFFGLIGGLLFSVSHAAARNRQAAVNMGVYKVYRFMHLQNAAGLSAVETLKHMHESTDVIHLKEGLRAYSTTYFRTMDPERSEQALYNHVRGQSASLLAATFKQGIELGNFMELVKRQEEIMLKAFYKGLEVKSQALHVKSVLVACGICLFIFLLLLMPILYEMQRATEAIFSF